MKRSLLSAIVLCSVLAPGGCAPYGPLNSGGPFGNPYGPVYRTVPVGYAPAPGSPPIVLIPAGDPPLVAGGPGTGSPPPILPPATPPRLPPLPVDPTVPATPAGPSTPATPAQPSAPAGTNPATGSKAWPLPPRLAQRSRPAGAPQISLMTHQETNTRRPRPLCVNTRPGSRAARFHHSKAALPGVTPRIEDAPQNEERATGIPGTPAEDLQYRGGKLIQHLSYVNLYVSGDEGWDPRDVQNIDEKLAAAMSDRNLNHVIMQYFNNRPVTSTALESHPLVGYRPDSVTKGDVQHFLQYLFEQGYLTGFDLENTCFNFFLPRGTILNDEDSRSDMASANAPAKTADAAEDEEKEKQERREGSIIPQEEEGNSLVGLGGYHGSIHLGGTTVYYSVGVYSEKRPDGTANGIPVFDQPWKSVVGTFYHELQEFRTDPDVEDAIRAANDPNAEKHLGWVSDRGMECGDFPIEIAPRLGMVFKEVPLTDGSGTVPVQFQYSNAVHGPEGPISAPHPLPR